MQLQNTNVVKRKRYNACLWCHKFKQNFLSISEKLITLWGEIRTDENENQMIYCFLGKDKLKNLLKISNLLTLRTRSSVWNL